MEKNQKIIPPSRLAFWRLILFVCGALAFGADWQATGYARSMGIDFLASTSWRLALTTLVLAGSFCLLSFGLTWTSWRDRILSVLEFGQDVHLSRLPGITLYLGIVASYLFFDTNQKLNFLLRSQDAFRWLVFLGFALAGAKVLKTNWKDVPLALVLAIPILVQASLHRIVAYLPAITDYPFALRWSETSRFYYPSLFLSQGVYGQRCPWPILHPSLHLLLVPPYLFNAPLWFHRFWQVAIRFLLLGLLSPALISRLKIHNRVLKWSFGLWVFLYLFVGPLYLHLAVPVLIMLWGFTLKDERRIWLALILSSIWCGISRINWYPMPGVFAASLYLLEVPYRGKSLSRYLARPTLWFVSGTMIALASERVYIALSGISETSFFFTSLSSDLLWYRLWPNASYNFGVLLGILIFSSPLLIAIGVLSYRHRTDWHPLRLGLLVSALLVLFAGGIIVSLKIGGGANLHNMDAYTLLLLIIFAYLFFGRYAPEDGRAAKPIAFHWSLIALLVLIPVWFTLPSRVTFFTYDHAEAQATLAALQQRVDQVNAQGEEILFITQRHLISMRMLKGAQLIPEYEREELMEMAMAQNKAYLLSFESDMRHHRFAAIIVDPLKFNYQDSSFAMGEENNAWVRYVVKPILCNYREDQAFPADSIAIYVPQDGSENCP
jgi:hypothetical protein